jgi:hypothetical protein
MPDLNLIVAAFTSPENIGTTPASMMWMFPLLAAIAAVYKANKLRVLFWNVFIREAGILFLFLGGFMILAIAVMNLVVWLITQ